MAADPKIRPADPLDQAVNVPIDGLPGHRKDPLALPESPRIEIALDPVLQQQIRNRHIPLHRSGERGLLRPSRPLFEGPEHHPVAIAVLDKTCRRQGQHFRNPRPSGPHEVEDKAVGGVFFGREQPQNLGFEEIDRHLLDGLQDQGAFGDEPVPVDVHGLDGKNVVEGIQGA